MKETYVTLEQAHALNRLGFNYDSFGWYYIGDRLIHLIEGFVGPTYFKDRDKRIPAPQQHVVQKWLREVKGIAINVIAHDNEWLRFKYSWNETYMQNCREKGKQWEEWSIVKHYGAHDTYEAALNEGITQILKLLEGKI